MTISGRRPERFRFPCDLAYLPRVIGDTKLTHDSTPIDRSSPLSPTIGNSVGSARALGSLKRQRAPLAARRPVPHIAPDLAGCRDYGLCLTDTNSAFAPVDRMLKPNGLCLIALHDFSFIATRNMRGWDCRASFETHPAGHPPIHLRPQATENIRNEKYFNAIDQALSSTWHDRQLWSLVIPGALAQKW
ncbi:uncharacterized protein BO80DRAFT_473031 [Aspergillus ibericus CBS 121593]|uniref:Methyltransferase domain-containing protein n=1 Tax=Aspergillus ibericus CBS 121593 TaxID=1448316 RepID=A0A395H4R2_9EURO|nr:hypothetical protein BO80DRAFT_473031 [Aspergillus ibericus CBS 121593]RAL01868.1 hypothetical protein BO80DRAFT_473031 [Aspergillus ibericus CBS 121593]